ncbi:SDR family oxidoreductase [Nostoc flagelliforme FACHB-838]|uniref:SDR family oxidoreductase n=1 Tax=Nostoc flagelliforme FACHB-838 TaxID=2692904 RepID=A0ABR8DT45_9NOSO|nr:SDR family oxidoreductase [Nostoc flagelliforme]MBD2532017.1 SDR family oxidoreductase [Nostoc flagelliforme FACHB-838]
MKLKPISQQVVAIVGASSGIGRETALRFAKKGAKVVVAARSQPGLATLVEEIKQLGGEAIAVVADVSEFEQVKAIADQTIATYGRLDTWVHLSGTSIVAPFDQITPEEFRRVIDVNLNGQAYGAMVALPHLKQGGGALIHVSSLAARVPFPLQSAYAASKHGIAGFLDSLRIELQYQKQPISVTNVMPAITNTPIFNKIRTKLGVAPAGLPPYNKPSTVADAILYVAQHPTRDFVVGDMGRILEMLQRIAPSIVDRLFLQVGFTAQLTGEPKSADAPDNLYAPISGYDTVEGDFGNLSVPSFMDWLDRNPPFKWGTVAIAAAFGFAAALSGFSG